MRPQRQHSSSSTEDASSPPVRTNGHKPIPIKASAENRKRSLTVGNTPDSIPKKHPYENIKEQIFIPQSPPLIDSALSKKPMPLPRPAGVVLKHPRKSSSNSEGSVVPKWSELSQNQSLVKLLRMVLCVVPIANELPTINTIVVYL